MARRAMVKKLIKAVKQRKRPPSPAKDSPTKGSTARDYSAVARGPQQSAGSPGLSLDEKINRRGFVHDVARVNAKMADKMGAPIARKGSTAAGGGTIKHTIKERLDQRTITRHYGMGGRGRVEHFRNAQGDDLGYKNRKLDAKSIDTELEWKDGSKLGVEYKTGKSKWSAKELGERARRFGGKVIQVGPKIGGPDSFFRGFDVGKNSASAPKAVKPLTQSLSGAPIAKAIAAGGKRRFLSRVPGVGQALDAYDIYQGYQADKMGGTGLQETKKAVGRSVGGAAGAFVGAKGGALAGAALGSIVPGIGTVVGGAIGGLIGGVAGGFWGSSGGEKLAGQGHSKAGR